MLFKKLAIFFILLYSLFLLTSCGFHLRGPTPLPPPLKSLYLQTPDPYGQLTRNLKRSLRMSGVELSSTPAGAKTVLVIMSETSGQQLLSVSGTQQTRQYNLSLTVTF